MQAISFLQAFQKFDLNMMLQSRHLPGPGPEVGEVG